MTAKERRHNYPGALAPAAPPVVSEGAQSQTNGATDADLNSQPHRNDAGGAVLAQVL